MAVKIQLSITLFFNKIAPAVLEPVVFATYKSGDGKMGISCALMTTNGPRSSVNDLYLPVSGIFDLEFEDHLVS